MSFHQYRYILIATPMYWNFPGLFHNLTIPMAYLHAYLPIYHHLFDTKSDNHRKAQCNKSVHLFEKVILFYLHEEPLYID